MCPAYQVYILADKTIEIRALGKTKLIYLVVCKWIALQVILEWVLSNIKQNCKLVTRHFITIHLIPKKI